MGQLTTHFLVSPWQTTQNTATGSSKPVGSLRHGRRALSQELKCAQDLARARLFSVIRRNHTRMTNYLSSEDGIRPAPGSQEICPASASELDSVGDATGARLVKSPSAAAIASGSRVTSSSGSETTAFARSAV